MARRDNYFLYLLSLRAILAASYSLPQGEEKTDRLLLLVAIAFPAGFANLVQAHNGFLTATLVIGCALATPYSLDYDLMLLAPSNANLALD